MVSVVMATRRHPDQYPRYVNSARHVGSFMIQLYLVEVGDIRSVIPHWSCKLMTTGDNSFARHCEYNHVQNASEA